MLFISPDFSSHPAEPLSSFSPVLGRNVFFDHTNDSTKLFIILKFSETFSFVGTVALTVLQGSISLFGSIIPASPIRHQVYAPKNYPSATIESIEYLNRYPATPTVPTFIKELVTESDAVIQIEDLQSGVQGLHQVCPTHMAIFEAPVGASFDFKLREFFPVCPPRRFLVPSNAHRSFFTVVPPTLNFTYLLHGPLHWRTQRHGRGSA
jgi:hypothetical protein